MVLFLENEERDGWFGCEVVREEGWSVCVCVCVCVQQEKRWPGCVLVRKCASLGIFVDLDLTVWLVFVFDKDRQTKHAHAPRVHALSLRKDNPQVLQSNKGRKNTGS